MLSYVYKIEALEEKMRRQNHFEVLGVSLFASAEDVEHAYGRVKKDVEMSEIADLLNDDARRKLQRIRERVDAAFECLRDDNAAAQYRREIRVQSRRRKESAGSAAGESKRPQKLGARVMSFFNRPIGGK